MAILRALLVLVVSTTCILVSPISAKYLPTWDSLDSRPLPTWYDEAKVGIFIHWGVFSVPSFQSEWFWWYWQGAKNNASIQFMKDNYPPDFTYADFGKQFTAEFFDAKEWADIFQGSGAKFIVFVSKHHEGFTNWPSKYSWTWNSQSLGPKRDIVGELANATRTHTDLKFGLYHSLYEWFNPLYLDDKHHGYSTQNFVKRKTMPELYELVNTYKPEYIWSDGDWEASDDYWTSKEFLAWLYNDSPVNTTVLTNDRWGKGVMCHHGGVYTCSDRYNPHVLVNHKWENAMTLDRVSWGFRRNAKLADILTIEELLEQLITTVSCNGNLLINVGPPHDGFIGLIYQERFKQLGSWLNVNGEAIYKTRPWSYQNDTATPGIWYTKNTAQQGTVYALMLQWPNSSELFLQSPVVSPNTEVTLVGYKGSALQYKPGSPAGLTIQIPPINFDDMPCRWAWTLKLTNVRN